MRVPRLFSIFLQIFLAGFGKNGQSDDVKTPTITPESSATYEACKNPENIRALRAKHGIRGAMPSRKRWAPYMPGCVRIADLPRQTWLYVRESDGALLTVRN